MEYIQTEAQEEGASEDGRDEEEDEDTGIDTYTQLFDCDTDSNGSETGRDTPEISLHQRLLHAQETEAEAEAENCPRGCGGLVRRARSSPRRGLQPRGVHDCASPDGPQHHQQHEGLRRGAADPAQAPGYELPYPLPTWGNGTPAASPHRGAQPPHGGRHARPPLRPLQAANGNPTARDAFHLPGDILPRLHGKRALRDAAAHTGDGEEAEATGAPSSAKKQKGQDTATPGTGKVLGEELLQRCLNAKNLRLTQLAVFKDVYTASFTELTRAFKSDKTQSYEWVFLLLGAASITYEILRECLKAHTEFILSDTEPQKRLGVFYLGFSAAKNREGLLRCLKNCNVDPACVVLSDPPNKRSPLAALFYQKLHCSHGEVPLWCRDLTSMGKLSGDSFELSRMVQWALDNKMYDEGTIAYNYAILAETDRNAQLWLESNSQAKYVRDAALMVRHYQRGRLHATPMNEYIASRMREYSDHDPDGWKRVVVFLAYQHIVLQDFLLHFRYWLSNRPKKSTIAIIGVPDSGKSMFTMSLAAFMEGKVLSYSNARSHFWLQPLAECKMGVIDDVTRPCWDYLDTYMRNALDGNPVCIDCKHRAPIQLRCPPLLLTSNYDPRSIKTYDGGDCQYKYLLSRIHFLPFNRVIPTYGEKPRFLIRPGDWRSFLLKYSTELGLQIQDYDYGEPPEGGPEPGGAARRPPGQGGRAAGEGAD
uniref:DNA 3'-5' helicase n=1 Tax=Duck papillomavirus TaxID=1867231 RepID=A0A193CKH8_9PAPI|nr:E1 [Duck papillomavirus]